MYDRKLCNICNVLHSFLMALLCSAEDQTIVHARHAHPLLVWKAGSGAGEMARQLIMLPAIAEDPGSNPSIYARWLITTYDYSFGRSSYSLWPPQEPTQTWRTKKLIQAYTHKHKLLINLKNWFEPTKLIGNIQMGCRVFCCLKRHWVSLTVC